MTAHDPAAEGVIEEEVWQFLGSDGVPSLTAHNLLVALTAADLSVVGEGYGRIGGQVVRLERIAVEGYSDGEMHPVKWSYRHGDVVPHDVSDAEDIYAIREDGAS